MKLTAHVFKDGDWYAAVCPEVPEANGQGRSPEEAVESLRAAIELVFEDRRAETPADLPPHQTLELVA